jgi:hypothetical protein
MTTATESCQKAERRDHRRQHDQCPESEQPLASLVPVEVNLIDDVVEMLDLIVGDTGCHEGLRQRQVAQRLGELIHRGMKRLLRGRLMALDGQGQ